MKNTGRILLAACLCACTFCLPFAQTPSVETPLIPVANATAARQLLEEALLLLDSNQFQAAEVRAESAYNYFKGSDGSAAEDLAQAAYLTGLAAFKLRKYGGALPFFEESAKIWSELFPEGSLKTADALHYAGSCIYYRGKLMDAQSAYARAYEIRQKLLPPNHCDISESLRVIGNIHFRMGEYAVSKEYYGKSLAIAEICAGKESARAADLLANLSVAYLRLSQYQKAIAMAEKALRIQQSILPPFHSDLGDSYRQLGTIYRTLRQFETAVEYLEKAHEVYQKNGKTNLAFFYSEFGQAYLNKGDHSKAQYYFEQEHQLMLASGDTASTNYAYTCGDFGILYYNLKNYPEAIFWFEKMVANWRQSYTYVNSQLASMQALLAQARLANGDFETALALFQDAKQIWETVFGDNSYLPLWADGWIANVYEKRYLNTGEDSLLEKSRASFRLGKKGVDLQMKSETTPDGHQKILAEAAPIFESAIMAELMYQNLHHDQESLENAWQWSEAMHGYHLYAATQEANARHFAGIPDAKLQQDSILGVQIALLGKKRQDMIEKGRSLTDSSVLDISLQIASKMEEARQLQAVFEKEYPEYYQLKYNFTMASLEESKKLLSPRQTLIEYFSGNTSIFVFVLQKNQTHLLELKRDFPMTDWVKQMRQGITGYYTAQEKKSDLYQLSVQQYAHYAQKLSEKLLLPLSGMLSPELIIIPGDGMADIPFEALLTAAPSDLSNFGTYPFALKQYTISYAYSATMLQEMATRKHREDSQGLLAFAPFFDDEDSSAANPLAGEKNQRKDLLPLPSSGEEVSRVSKNFTGNMKLLIGSNATKDQFLELAERYRVIHLATHGKANQKAGEFSYLAFYLQNNPSEEGLLSAAELYNCTLNADLVVLSACETGVGEAQQGEGVISLARAFAYAGAKSIVASLWSVADKSTMLVMDSFYDGLKTGALKNNALSNAKRQYIDKHPGLESHPFFWAGFVHFGDVESLKN